MTPPGFRSTRVRVLLAAAAILVTVAPSASASTAPPRIDVTIRTMTYDPSVVTVAALGERVRWSNTTSPSRVHDVVSNLPDYFHMPLGGTGTHYAVTFRAAGYFTYYCSIHDTMLGAVSVPLTGQAITDAGGSRFRLFLSSRAWPAGSRYVSVVSVQGPADAAPRYWRTTRRASLDFVPTQAGTYAFTASVRDNQTRRLSGATPALSFTFGG